MISRLFIQQVHYYYTSQLKCIEMINKNCGDGVMAKYCSLVIVLKEKKNAHASNLRHKEK